MQDRNYQRQVLWLLNAEINNDNILNTFNRLLPNGVINLLPILAMRQTIKPTWLAKYYCFTLAEGSQVEPVLGGINAWHDPFGPYLHLFGITNYQPHLCPTPLPMTLTTSS